MSAAIVFRPCEDEELNIQEIPYFLSQDQPPFPAREIWIHETTEKTFNSTFVEQCKRLTQQMNPEQAFASVVAFCAIIESDTGLRSMWWLVPPLLPGLVEVRLTFGRHISSLILTSFFKLLACQFLSQSRFSRVRKLFISLALDHFDAGERLNISLAILKMCSSCGYLQHLALPIDTLAVAWQDSIACIKNLAELSHLSLYPGRLELPFSIAAISSSSDSDVGCLTNLTINAPLASCATIIEKLSSSLTKLDIECDTPAGMTDAFAKIRSSCLQAQDATRPLSPLTRNLSPTLSAISSMFRIRALPAPVLVSSLTHLDMKFTDGTMGIMDLQALYPLCGMQVFTVSCPSPIFYDRNNIADLLSCWPGIVKLSLNPRPSEGLSLGLLPSFNILEAVARCGPSLHEFHACLDGFASLQLADSNRSWQSLRKLDLGYSIGPMEYDSIENTVKYISALFSTLERIQVQDPHEEWPSVIADAFRRRIL